MALANVLAAAPPATAPAVTAVPDPRPLCPACRTPLDLTMTRLGLSLHPGCEPLPLSPDEVASQIFGIVAEAIDNQPRSLQKRIGPSEIGIPCDRRIGHKLAGTTPVNNQGVSWKPFVGTAVHNALADIMVAHEIGRFAEPSATPRWHVEEKVSPGLVLNGEDIDGSCDLYDAHTGGVFDWKITTKNRIREHYRPHGPGAQYETQAHEYGVGWVRKGLPVRFVAIIFMTRDGEFKDRYVWSAAFDPMQAVSAHERVTGIDRAMSSLGPEFTLPTLSTADSWCRFCPYLQRGATDLTKACPGHPTDEHAPQTLAGALGLG